MINCLNILDKLLLNLKKFILTTKIFDYNYYYVDKHNNYNVNNNLYVGICNIKKKKKTLIINNWTISTVLTIINKIKQWIINLALQSIYLKQLYKILF